MNNPHPKPYSTTVFVVEGIKLAVVVTTVAGRMTQRRRKFATPEAALIWCRSNGAGMFYSPAAEIPASN